MSNDNKRASRASQTREKESQKKQVWTPPSSLDAPPAPTGFQHRWGLNKKNLPLHELVEITKTLGRNWSMVGYCCHRPRSGMILGDSGSFRPPRVDQKLCSANSLMRGTNGFPPITSYKCWVFHIEVFVSKRLR